ncbi:hypothetical protein T484DRAFT_1915277, partial [Baffinella frigidus]
MTLTTFTSSTLIACTSPPLPPGTTLLQVSTPDALTSEVSLSAALELTVHPPTEVHALAPSVGHAGASLAVRVSGAHFLASSEKEASCALGDVAGIPATVLSSSSLLCHLPAARPMGFARLEVASSGGGYTEVGKRVETLEPLVITGLDPASVTLGASVQSVTVTGSPFPATDFWSCKVGATITPAAWTAGGIVCALGGVSLKTNSSIAISLDGHVFFPAPLALQLLPLLRVDRVTPVAAPPLGGGYVTLAGAFGGDRGAADDWRCSFGGVLTTIEYLDAGRVRCAAPEHAPARVSLSVVRGDVLLSNQVSFNFIPGTSLLEVSPSLGLASGGTRVAILTDGASLLGEVLCLFGGGSAPVRASRVNATHAECVTPRTALGQVAVALLHEGVRSMGPGPEFLFVELETLAALRPTSVAVGAGATVTVLGSNFLDVPSLACFFNGRKAAAEWVSPSAVECTAPVLSRGEVAVSVANNGNANERSSATATDTNHTGMQMLAVVSERVVTRVAPSVAHVGGGLTVVLHGLNLAGAPEMVRVGSSTQLFTVINGSAGSFQLPPAPPGMYPVGFHALSSVTGDEQVTSVRYIEHPVLLSLAPTAAPAAGGVQVTVFGSGFVADIPASCAVGESAASAATFLTSSSLLCTSPPLAGAQGALSVAVEVTYNGAEFSRSNLHLLLCQPATLTRVTPSSAVASGSQVVTVFGTHFPASPGAASVRFGRVPTPLAWVTSSVATCVAPPSPGGRNVTLHVAAHGHESASPGVAFSFLAEHALLTLRPSRVPASGGASLTVYGRFFAAHDRVVCSFSFPSSPDGAIGAIGSIDVSEAGLSEPRATAATILPDGRAVCPSPRAHPGETRLTAEILFNGTALRPLVALELFRPASVDQILPVLLLGAASVPVTILGSGFSSSTAAVCLFTSARGPVRAAATLISSNRVSCSAPSLDSSMAERVAVSLLGESSVEADGEAFLERRATPLITSLSPRVAVSAPGQVLVVTGKHLAPSRGVACLFSGPGDAPDLAVSAHFVSGERLECMVPVGRSGRVLLRTASLAGAAHSAAVSLVLVREPEVVGVEPSMGTVEGGTALRVRVTSLAVGAAYWCRFGDVAVDATADETGDVTVADGGVLLCTSPPADHLGAARLSIGWRVHTAEGTSAEDAKFVYHASVIVSSVYPTRVSTSGGDTLTLSGSFPTGVPIECMVGSERDGHAHHVSSTQILCATPARQTGTASVHVTTNGADYITALESLLFEDAMLVTSVNPTVASSAASLVTVSGAGFVPSEALRCCVGTRASATATFLSATRVICDIARVAHSAANISLSVANHGPCAPSSVTVQLRAPLSSASVSPTRAPRSGGSVLALTFRTGAVSGGLPPSVCNFGGEQRAVVERDASLSPERFTCILPRLLTPQRLRLVVRTIANGVEIAGMDFEVYHDPSVAAVIPAIVGETGGCAVTVVGQGFRSDGADVSFGGVVAEATFVSSSVLVCTAPAASENGKVSVEVSLNGVDFSRSGKTMVYWPRPSVSSIVPSGGAQSGGSEVTVHGEHFHGMVGVWCRFGMTGGTVAGTLVSGMMVTCSRPERLVGSVAVEVSNNGVEYSEDGVMYMVSASSVATVWPTRGSLKGGTMLTVAGVNLDSVEELTCEFNTGSSAGLKGDGTWTCATPRPETLGEVSVRVSAGGQELDNGRLKFEYVLDSMVTSVVPSSGSISGGFTVTVHGEGFVATGTSVCVFSGTWSVGRVVSANEVECVVPRVANPQEVKVGVSSNGVDISTGTTTFLYRSMAKLVSLSPSKGSDVGKTLVTVSATGLSGEDLIACRFGRMDEWRMCRGLVCHSPASTTGGNVSVSVKRVGESSSFGELPFLFVGTQGVRSVRPSAGSMRGGTTVEIVLQRSAGPEEFSCVVGSQTAAGRYSESGNAVCEMPLSRTAGEVQLQLYFEHELVTGAMFLYTAGFSVEEMFPTQGLASGGTEVLITGSGFPASGGMQCKFGSVSAEAVVQSGTTAVRCRSPALSPGTSTVSLSANGVDFDPFPYPFQAIPPMRITSILPSTYHIAPSSSSILTIHGSRFLTLPDIRCRMQERLPSPAGGGAHVFGAATVLSPHTLLCAFPPGVVGMHGACNVDLVVSRTVVPVYDTPVTVHVLPTIFLLRLAPSSGPASGGVQVTVLGEGFSGGEVECVFGSTLAPAVLVSSSAVVCTSPPQNAGPASVHLLFDGSQSNSLSYTFLHPAVITSVVPSSSALAGGALVTVSGAAFTDESCCRFGAESACRSARLLSSSTLLCAAPPHPSGEVRLSVDHSAASLPFRFRAAPAILRVTPDVVPADGSASIALYTDGPASGNATCYFGERLPAVRAVADGRAWMCHVPVARPGKYEVRVDVETGVVSNAVSFTVVDALVILALSPTAGPRSGGTTVTISGALLSSAGLQCAFGGSLVPADVMSSSMARCVSPAGNPGVETVRLLVLVGSARRMSVSSAAFELMEEAVVTVVVPSRGNSAGGTLVTVKGAGFADASGVCRFGTSRVPYAFVSTSEIVCVSPPVAFVATVTVEVSANRRDFTNDGLAFALDPPPALHSVTPSELLWTGRASTITVAGEFFLEGAFACVLGGTVLPEAMVLSSYIATCRIPPFRPGVNASLCVSNDFSSFSSSSLLLSARAPPSAIPTLSPTLGSVTGGTTIAVHAAGFSGDVRGLLIGGVACACDGPPLACTCAPSEAGPARVELVLDGGALVPLEPFVYKQDPVVTEVTPSVASAMGGAILTIHGRDLSSAGAKQCVFADGESAEASVVSSTRLLCASPAASPGVTSVDVALEDGILRSSASLPFWRMLPPTLLRLSPASVPRGSSLITVHGRGFLPGVTWECLSSGTRTRGQASSDATGLACGVSPSSPGQLAVEVGWSDSESTHAGIFLGVFDAVSVTRVAPTHGPASGGEPLHLFGAAFPVGGDWKCVFGNVEVPGSVLSSSYTKCLSPPHVPGVVSLFSVVDGVSSVSTSREFWYHDGSASPEVVQILPSSGPPAGGTPVTVTGHNLFPLGNESVQCHFGSAAPRAAEMLTADAAVCISPAAGIDAVVSVQVSRNNVFSAEDVEFLYQPAPVVKSITPGTLVLGEDRQVVVSAARTEGSSKIYCRFGEAHRELGLLLSNSEVSCHVPGNLSAGNYSVRLSNNGVDFSRSGVSLHLVPRVIILSVSPSVVSTTGGAGLTVRGSNFPFDAAG